MKILKQLLIGGVVGFVGVLLLLNLPSLHVEKYANIIVIGLFVVVVLLLGVSLLFHIQIKKLSRMEFHGDEEDEVDVIKYRKFNDYSLVIQSSSVIVLLALCFALIASKNIVLIIIGIILSLVSYLFTFFMMHLMKVVHPERNIPEISDPKFTEKLLDEADDGEKYIIMHGLYKSHNLLNSILVFAIVGSTIYSLVSEHSQLFSVILMALVLLIVNGNYLLSVRNK